MEQTAKTDVDHTLGFCNNSVYCLWPTDHAVNQYAHHIRSRAKKWLHAYAPDEAYAEKVKDRGFPSFWDKQPAML